MRKIVRYEILSFNLFEDGPLKECFKTGWQPHGGPFLKDGSILQAVVKYEDEAPLPEKTKLFEFTIVNEISDDFYKEYTALIRDGWEPCGSSTSHPDPIGTRLIQKMKRLIGSV